MKKFFALLLALAMIFALAACGDTKEADVVAEGDVKDTTIETPPPAAIISGPDTPQEQYPSVNVLPATDPTPNANPGAVIAPATGTTPSAGNVTGTTGNTGAAPSAGGGTATGVPIENYSPNSGTGTTGTTGTGEPVYDNILDDPNFVFADDNGEDYRPTATWDERNSAKTAYTDRPLVNFRVGPGQQYKIYESLPKGAEFKLLSYHGSWAKICYNGNMIGYIWKDYITFTRPADANTNIAPAPTNAPASVATPSPSPDSTDATVIVTP